MPSRVSTLVFSAASLLLSTSAVPNSAPATQTLSMPHLNERAGPTEPPLILAEPIFAAPIDPAPPSPPLSASEALQQGVLIVVSKPSQKMFVFKEGKAWDSSPISTGRRGHSTPAGVFPILQKRIHHRSNLYDNAPMPYMQRLTWGGVALHAGKLPGYPASHGCIRLPREFARRLYAITNFTSTIVLVTDQVSGSSVEAHILGGGAPTTSVLAQAPTRAPAHGQASVNDRNSQTIQLAAAASPHNAAALWQKLLQRQPQLRALRHAIIPATVRSREFFRLRATGQQAHDICSTLKSSGVACLKV